MDPGGKVVGVSVLFTATVSLLRFNKRLVTLCSNGKCPPMCIITSSEFNHYNKQIITEQTVYIFDVVVLCWVGEIYHKQEWKLHW